jgi:hypothetical protein
MAPPQLADRSVLVRIAVAIRAALRRALGRSEPARRPVPGERPEPPTRPQPEPFRQTDLFMTEPLPPTRAGSALYTAGAHNPITAADAEHLLQGITGLSFADPDAEVQERLFYALNELAWWPSHEHVDELALEWIKRIYLVRPFLVSPPNSCLRARRSWMSSRTRTACMARRCGACVRSADARTRSRRCSKLSRRSSRTRLPPSLARASPTCTARTAVRTPHSSLLSRQSARTPRGRTTTSACVAAASSRLYAAC